MTDVHSPTPSPALIQLLQERLSALPSPSGAPAPNIERLLAFLGCPDPDAAGPPPDDGGRPAVDAALVHSALLDAALLSVLEAFDALPRVGDADRTPEHAPEHAPDRNPTAL